MVGTCVSLKGSFGLFKCNVPQGWSRVAWFLDVRISLEGALPFDVQRVSANVLPRDAADSSRLCVVPTARPNLTADFAWQLSSFVFIVYSLGVSLYFVGLLAFSLVYSDARLYRSCRSNIYWPEKRVVVVFSFILLGFT